jgi:hypothetical protein
MDKWWQEFLDPQWVRSIAAVLIGAFLATTLEPVKAMLVSRHATSRIRMELYEELAHAKWHMKRNKADPNGAEKAGDLLETLNFSLSDFYYDSKRDSLAKVKDKRGILAIRKMHRLELKSVADGKEGPKAALEMLLVAFEVYEAQGLLDAKLLDALEQKVEADYWTRALGIRQRADQVMRGDA